MKTVAIDQIGCVALALQRRESIGLEAMPPLDGERRERRMCRQVIPTENQKAAGPQRMMNSLERTIQPIGGIQAETKHSIEYHAIELATG